MKCSQPKCGKVAEFARDGETESWCVGHSPIHIPPLHDLDELPVNGWDHVDVMRKCDVCEEWRPEDECERQSCDEHYACSSCEADMCAVCKDAAEYVADVRSV